MSKVYKSMFEIPIQYIYSGRHIIDTMAGIKDKTDRLKERGPKPKPIKELDQHHHTSY